MKGGDNILWTGNLKVLSLLKGGIRGRIWHGMEMYYESSDPTRKASCWKFQIKNINGKKVTSYKNH